MCCLYIWEIWKKIENIQHYKARLDSTKIINIIGSDINILSGTISQYLSTNIILLLCFFSEAEYYSIFKNEPNIYIQQILNYNKHNHKMNIDMILGRSPSSGARS
jgi:hypothetical protein